MTMDGDRGAVTGEPQIRLASSARSAMAAAAAAAWPQEACGLLLGRRTASGVLRIEHFRPTSNEAAEPRREYRIPPLELLAAGHEAERDGLEIAGVWHSHPDAPAVPSQRDAAEAWEGYSYGIETAGRDADGSGADGELRFFAQHGGLFRELPWELGDDERREGSS